MGFFCLPSKCSLVLADNDLFNNTVHEWNTIFSELNFSLCQYIQCQIK